MLNKCLVSWHNGIPTSLFILRKWFFSLCNAQMLLNWTVLFHLILSTPRNSAAHDAGITCLLVAKDADSSTWYVCNLQTHLWATCFHGITSHVISLHHLLKSSTEVCRSGLVSVIGSFRAARLPGQATCTAVSKWHWCVVWWVFGRGAVSKGEHCAQLVLCPACVCLPARNGLVNKVKFIGLITQKW